MMVVVVAVVVVVVVVVMMTLVVVVVVVVVGMIGYSIGLTPGRLGMGMLKYLCWPLGHYSMNK